MESLLSGICKPAPCDMVGPGPGVVAGVGAGEGTAKGVDG